MQYYVLKFQVQVLAAAIGMSQKPPAAPPPPPQNNNTSVPNLHPDSVKLINDMADATKKLSQQVKESKEKTKTALKKVEDGEEFTADDIKLLLQDPAFREEIGLKDNTATTKLIDRLASQYQYNSKLLSIIDKNTNQLIKEIANEYGAEKTSLAEAIHQGDTKVNLPENTGTKERYEFAIARFHLYQKRNKQLKDQLNPLKLIGETINAAIPVISAIVWTLTPELAIDIFMAMDLVTILKSKQLLDAFAEVADQPINEKRLDIRENRNNNQIAHKLAIAKVVEILPEGIPGLDKAKESAKNAVKEAEKVQKDLKNRKL